MQLLAEAENEVHGLKIGEKGITLLIVVCAAFHPFFHRGILHLLQSCFEMGLMQRSTSMCF